MKPSYRCSECQHELSWGDQYCGNCGRPIDWPAEGSRKPQGDGKRSRAERPEKKSPPAASWKLMLGFALFLVAGVVVLELLTETKNIPAGAPTPTQSADPSANMQAMNQLGELEQIAKANPGTPKALLQVANFAHDNHFYDKAVDYYKQYLAKEPKDADALVDLGICYNDLGNLDEARASMEQALKYSPKHVLAHFNLGIVSLRSGDMKGALEWFKQTVALSPNSEIGKRAQELITQHLNAGQQ